MTNWHIDELEEAGKTLVEEGNYSHTVSASLLGELMIFAAEDYDGTWEEWGYKIMDRLLEIARTYMRGA